jgi:hypothetical protein
MTKKTNLIMELPISIDVDQPLKLELVGDTVKGKVVVSMAQQMVG